MSVHSQARHLRFKRRYRGIWTHLDIIEAQQWARKVGEDLDWFDKNEPRKRYPKHHLKKVRKDIKAIEKKWIAEGVLDKNWRRKSDKGGNENHISQINQKDLC